MNHKSKDKLELIFNDLRTQLDTKYFVVVGAITRNCRNSKQVRIFDVLMQKVVKTSIAVCFLFHSSKFARKGDKTITPYALSYYKRNMPATETALFVYALMPGNRRTVYECLENLLSIMYEYHVGDRQVPKVLIIAIVETKTGGWKQMLRSFFRTNGFFDINVLEILVSRQKSKSNADMIHSHKMYHLNPFSKKFFSSPIKKGIKWFPDKLNNLHRYPCYTFTAKEATLWEGRETDTYFRLNKIGRDDFIKSLPKLLNVTLKRMSIPAPGRFNIFGKVSPLSKYFKTHIMPTVKPLDQLIEVLFVPVIYDEEIKSDDNEVLLNVTTLLLLVVTVYLWTMAFEASPWSPLSIFGMIVMQSNSQAPVTRSQCTLFICLIAIGFFFGSELTEGLTSANIVMRKERKLENLDDLRLNNITALLNPVGVRYAEKHNKPFKRSGVKLDGRWRKFIHYDYFKKEVIGNLILHQNYSISTAFEEYSGVNFPRTLVDNNIVLAKRSNIVSEWRTVSLRMIFSNSYVNRVSDIYWRYVEAGLRQTRDDREYKRNSTKAFNKIRDQITGHQDEGEEPLDQMESLSIFVYLITIGPLVSLIVLIFELVLHKFF